MSWRRREGLVRVPWHLPACHNLKALGLGRASEASGLSPERLDACSISTRGPGRGATGISLHEERAHPHRKEPWQDWGRGLTRVDLMPTLSAAWKARVKFLRCKRDCMRVCTMRWGSRASTCHQSTYRRVLSTWTPGQQCVTAPHRPGHARVPSSLQKRSLPTISPQPPEPQTLNRNKPVESFLPVGTSRLSEGHEGLKVGCAGAGGELSPDPVPKQLPDRTLRPLPGPRGSASAILGLEGRRRAGTVGAAHTLGTSLGQFS